MNNDEAFKAAIEEVCDKYNIALMLSTYLIERTDIPNQYQSKCFVYGTKNLVPEDGLDKETTKLMYDGLYKYAARTGHKPIGQG